ncbi:hypothetical protein N9164_09950 [Draconibacterium sp.]|nr:hypothetical protein [Draconibacterium sp.]
MRWLILLIIFSFPFILLAQSSNHWARNFNEESSLLSGAVVGGGAGPSAIFYNPASIAEIEESKLSINASLFSFDFFKAKNAWGDGVDYISTRFIVVPRFVSFMLKPQKNRKWSLEFAYLVNENYQTNNINSIDEFIDVLKYLPGEERYNAFYHYDNKFRDDWLGAGGSYKINSELFLGISMFVSTRSLNYSYMVDIEAGQPNSRFDENESAFFTAKFKDQEYLKFNNYRLISKLGLLYKKENISFGLNITTPSLNVYSDGKRVMRKKSQSNITHPETGEPVPNYLVSDYAEIKDVRVNYKNPLSIAAGVTWQNPNKTKTIYTTVEFFTGLDPYRMVEADEKYQLINDSPDLELLYDDWLTYIWGAKAIFNAAIGYRWIVKENMMILTGFRTDFNYRKNFDYSPLLENRTIEGFQFDRYHLTGGLTAKVLGQDLMAGLQYTFGFEKNQKQFINLSDPIEYIPETHTSLQGIRKNNMNTIWNSISLYFGATFNFGGNKEK